MCRVDKGCHTNKTVNESSVSKENIGREPSKTTHTINMFKVVADSIWGGPIPIPEGQRDLDKIGQ